MIYKKNNRMEATKLDEETLMITDPENETTYILNTIMFFIWEHCDEECFCKEPVDFICNQFDTEDIENAEIQNDVQDALTQLLDNEIILLQSNNI